MSRLKTTVAALFVVLFGACGPDRGSIRIELTDAPSDDLLAAVVTIERIYLQGDGGRIVLRDDPVVVDLLSLSNDIQTLVADHPVPDGSYAQLRFVISGAYIELDDHDGTTSFYATHGYSEAPRIDAELVTPSWDASGFKIQFPDGRLVVDGDQRILLVDFDVAASFTHQTGSGDWVATPVLRALDIGLTSTLHVDVTVPGDPPPVLSAPLVVTLADGGGLSEGSIELLDVDGDGVFSGDFLFLDPRQGPYVLTIESPLGTTTPTEPATPIAVTLSSGTTTSVGFVVTDASGL